MKIAIKALAIKSIAAALLALAWFAAPAAAHEQQFGDLVLFNAWARATPTGAKTGAVYVRIDNKGTAADKLIGVGGDIAAKIQVHNMTTDNGTMKMGPAGDVEIPAQGSVDLAPHGLHIMMMGLKKPLAEGDTFPLTLTFEKAGSVEMQVVVEPTNSTGGHDSGEGGTTTP